MGIKVAEKYKILAKITDRNISLVPLYNTMLIVQNEIANKAKKNNKLILSL
jgi:hypothetical protein